MSRFTAIASLIGFLSILPLAQAGPIEFVYDLSSDTTSTGRSDTLSGSITFVGDAGDTVPLLDSAAVESFSFTMSGPYFDETWVDGAGAVVNDDAGFDGTLGASTLTATSGEWTTFLSPEFDLDLYGTGDPGGPYSELWDEMNPGPFDVGFSWTLSLESETPTTAPEPVSAGLAAAGLGLFAIFRGMRRNGVKGNPKPLGVR